MRVWMVRAGSQGEREQVALAEGRAIAGWPEVADLTGCETKSQVRRLVRSTYNEERFSSAVVGNWAGQLWRFRGEIQVDDLLLQPSKLGDRPVAIGRVTGNYYYLADEEPGFRHSRPIEWLRTDVPREQLGPDIRTSLGSLLTVCRISRPGVADRLQAVLAGREDPGPPVDDAHQMPADFGELADRVAEGPLRVSIRDLLAYKGYMRRTSGIVAEITNDLAELGLLAVPSISEGWIDGDVNIVQMPGDESPDETVEPDESTAAPQSEIDSAEAEAERVLGGSVKYAVSTMSTAACQVLSARPDEPLKAVVTRMALNDFSQVAVVDESDRLLGAVTWESIALAWMSGSPVVVRDALRPARSTAPNDELLAQATAIYDEGFVFVRDSSGAVRGIITSADLTKRFGDDHRPIVLLDEIEARLGLRIRSACSVEEVKAAGVHVGASGEYTFGNYVAVLNVDSLWGKLDWHGLDRCELHATMDRVRRIRNQLMHFSPDPITPEEVHLLEKVARALRLVTSEAAEADAT